MAANDGGGVRRTASQEPCHQEAPGKPGLLGGPGTWDSALLAVRATTFLCQWGSAVSLTAVACPALVPASFLLTEPRNCWGWRCVHRKHTPFSALWQSREATSYV